MDKKILIIEDEAAIQKSYLSRLPLQDTKLLLLQMD